ncbi:unnamed protein product, partial [Rotaria magnacalcarata]
HPLRSWAEAGLEKGVIDVIEAAGYKVIFDSLELICTICSKKNNEFFSPLS